MTYDYEAHDAKIKEMEERFGGKWQELCLGIVNVPAAKALDDLWEGIIRKRDPNYPDWEYPGQAYRHLLAEYNDLVADADNLRTLLAATLPILKAYHSILSVRDPEAAAKLLSGMQKVKEITEVTK